MITLESTEAKNEEMQNRKQDKSLKSSIMGLVDFAYIMYEVHMCTIIIIIINQKL